MKRIFILGAGLFTLGLLGAWFAPSQQSVNISAFLHDTVAQAPAVYTNTPDTSSSFSMGSYIGAAVFAQVGVVDNASSPGYLVYQDSSGTASWTTRDSVLVDTVDNASFKLHFLPRGPNTQIRTIFRGTGAAADTAFLSATLLRSCQTVPC